MNFGVNEEELILFIKKRKRITKENKLFSKENDEIYTSKARNITKAYLLEANKYTEYPSNR